MNRIVMMTILKLCGEAIVITIIAGIVVGAIGYFNKWDSARAYSDGFFIAACVVFIGCASSRLGSGQQWTSFQTTYAESFRDMPGSERANFIIQASSSFRLVILGVLSAILLIVVSAILMKMP